MADRRPAGAVVGWSLVAVCVLYGVFAVGTVAVEGAHMLRGDGIGRAAPPLFLAHALAGGVALIAGPVQLRLARRMNPRRPAVHRRLGRTYVVAALVTSAGSVPVAAAFDVGTAAKIAFFLGSAAWFASTVAAVRAVRGHDVANHRRWMIRSVALAGFFVTFSLWTPLAAALPVPAAPGYAAAVLLSWALNLLIAEVWLRRRRRTVSSDGGLGTMDACPARPR